MSGRYVSSSNSGEFKYERALGQQELAQMIGKYQLAKQPQLSYDPDEQQRRGYDWVKQAVPQPLDKALASAYKPGRN